MTSTSDISPAPWNRHDWSGKHISIDGAPADDFEEDDVCEVVAYGTTPGDWDGDTAGVVRLERGTFVAWEADWGPTGNGFCCDAYGGTADIWHATTLEAAISLMSERGLELIGKR